MRLRSVPESQGLACWIRFCCSGPFADGGRAIPGCGRCVHAGREERALERLSLGRERQGAQGAGAGCRGRGGAAYGPQARGVSAGDTACLSPILTSMCRAGRCLLGCMVHSRSAALHGQCLDSIMCSKGLLVLALVGVVQGYCSLPQAGVSQAPHWAPQVSLWCTGPYVRFSCLCALSESGLMGRGSLPPFGVLFD